MSLKSFFDLVLSVKEEPSPVPLLRNLAQLNTPGVKPGGDPGLLGRKINRHYHRLCRVQEDLGRLDFNKAGIGGTSSPEKFEDFVFSQTDFSRYREMEAKYFERLFPEGLWDFDKALFKNNFGLDRTEVKSIIEDSYIKEQGYYKLQRENSLILSIMRTLDTSLENSKLFSMEEVQNELENIISILYEQGYGPPDSEQLYRLLVMSLDGLIITHSDGMKTKLFVSPAPDGSTGDFPSGSPGDLSATFHPGNKAWTRVLIPGAQY